MASPFTWTGVRPSRSDVDAAQQRQTRTRFTGTRAFSAPFYAALWPGAAPQVVDGMTPSQIAAVLGLDRLETVRAVPLEDAPFVPLAGEGERRVRRVVGG